MAVQWPEDNKDRFMIRMEDGGDHGVSGYAFASVSDVTNLVADNEHAREEGEPERSFSVWRLTDGGPVPATIRLRGHLSISRIEVILQWRIPGRGRVRMGSESGFYRMSEV